MTRTDLCGVADDIGLALVCVAVLWGLTLAGVVVEGATICYKHMVWLSRGAVTG